MLRQPRWTKEEIDILSNEFPRLSMRGTAGPITLKVLLSILPKKSWNAIKWKARQLNLKRDFRTSHKPIQLPDIDKGYVAGLTDGEGSISLTKCKRKSGIFHYYPCIDVANTNLDALKWVESIIGFGKVRRLKHTEPNERTEKWRQRPWTWSKCYTYGIHHAGGCYAFLKEIGEVLKIKKTQAQLVMEFLEIEAERPLPKPEHDPNSGIFTRKSPQPHTERQHEIYQELRKINKRREYAVLEE